MARLFEYQGKELLKKNGINIPKGFIAKTPKEAEKAAKQIGGDVVIKAQSWTTSRAASGGIVFAKNAKQAAEKARGILGKKMGNFSVEKVLVEEKLKIKEEFYGGIIIHDKVPGPVLIFNRHGGSGVEEKAEALSLDIDIIQGLHPYQATNVLKKAGLSGKTLLQVSDVLVKLFNTAKQFEARSAEINPIVVTEEGKVYAADCRMTVDDYSVFRHPELGIEIARELSNPPTLRDKIAHDVEFHDYRGTFYFIQMEHDYKKNARYVGFHGAGGGGSMMSMDALIKNGFKVANFCDTSGNPPASKVYRAAKIILSQNNIDAYFGSGSGVASQEQIHSARGLVKAFREANLNIPAVIRLGGNMEDEAVNILQEYTKDLPAPVEGYKRDDSASFCAERLDILVKNHKPKKTKPLKKFKKPAKPYSFRTVTNGTVTFDHAICAKCASKVCIEKCHPGILKEEKGKPVLKISKEDALKGKCTECLACELECEHIGMKSARIDLPILGFAKLSAKKNTPTKKAKRK